MADVRIAWKKELTDRMLITVSGASGFVGQALCNELLARGSIVRYALRSLKPVPESSLTDMECFAVGNIGAETDWSAALLGVDCVVHCAARAHVIHETKADVLAAYRAVNVAGTRQLAEQAVKVGVRRLVFLSSIRVHGMFTTGSRRFRRNDEPKPMEPYAISKWEAEYALHEIAARTGLEVVIVRPPLVYGPRAKGNMARLLGLVARGLPLPFGTVDNRRSLIGLDNLVDLLIRCVEHPRAVGQIFLASDGEDLSTPELLRRIASAMDCSARLFPVPVFLLRLAGRALGRLNEIDRLVGSLQVDSSYTREVLDWTPPVSVDEGLRKTAEWYLNRR